MMNYRVSEPVKNGDFLRMGADGLIRCIFGEAEFMALGTAPHPGDVVTVVLVRRKYAPRWSNAVDPSVIPESYRTVLPQISPALTPSDVQYAATQGRETERTRTLAWLASMEPSREPYSRASSEFERQVTRRLWERMKEAIEGGKEPPKGEL